MAQKTMPGNDELAKRLKSRRNELGLTIEEAALRAGVGTKTWSRYEAGESIRRDKCKGICKALNWRDFPNSESESKPFLEECREHKAWSQFLAENYGYRAALSFAVGSDLLLDYLEQDLSDLSSMPLGSHIGQLRTSFIKDELPAQFLVQYNYEFLYQMRCTLIKLRIMANVGQSMLANSVMEELLIYLCSKEANTFIELSSVDSEFDDDEKCGNDEDWIFDLFDDMDIITYLYSDCNLEEEHPYHFSHWADRQFYTD